VTLVFDTETTGIANFRAPAEHPSQPRIVQLGAILFDDAERVVAELNVMVKPEGFTIPPEASDVHGITTDRAERYGIGIATVLGMFGVLCSRAETLVAHNFDFDRLVVESEFCRQNARDRGIRALARSSYCTMRTATDVCRIPGPRGYKWPNLQEAHRFFFNEGFEGAHDAMADVRACARVYFELNRRLAAAGGAS
jgi:DNA polymerase III epsilon subunit-like protein